MMAHLDDQTLGDLLDDALDAPARSTAEHHLASCDACA
jgi:anti-sigma factor RsiW